MQTEISIALYINIVVLLPDVLWSPYSTTNLFFPDIHAQLFQPPVKRASSPSQGNLAQLCIIMHLSKRTKPAGTPIVIANLDVTEASSTSLLHLHGISCKFALSPFTPMHSLLGKELWVPEEGLCPRCSQMLASSVTCSC